MKKIYTATMAFAIASSAFAMPQKQASMQEVNNVQTKTFELNTRESQKMKAPEITKVDDIVGLYFTDYTSGMAGTCSGTAVIEKGAKENDVIVTGLCARGSEIPLAYKLNGEFQYDATTKRATLVFPRQVVDAYYGYEMLPVNGQSGSLQGAYTLTVAPQGLVTTDKDGNQEYLYEDGCIAALNYNELWISTETYFAQNMGLTANYNMVLTKVSDYGDESNEIFTYNPSEWNLIDSNATFEDGVFKFISDDFDIPAVAQNVEVYQKADGSAEFLVKNAFNPWSVYNNNGLEITEGFIYINATRPDCVLARTNVFSGVNDDDFFVPLGNIYIANEEGYMYYFNDYDYDDIIDDLEWFKKDISSMETEGSDVTITIHNTNMSVETDMFNYVNYFPGFEYQVPEGEDPLVYLDSCVLKFKNDGSGVNNVISDNDKVAKRYFNLQGVEISNPAAGEVVIVKDGKKAKKVVF